jgi:glycosidase
MRLRRGCIGLGAALALGWGRAATAGECDTTGNDGDIAWNGLRHDSFDSAYRAPFGAVPAGSGSVTLRLRTCRDDADRVRLRIWDAVAAEERWVALSRDGSATDPALGAVDLWSVTLPVPGAPTILYYFFEVGQGEDVDYYVDDDPRFAGGGTGAVSDGWDDSRSFQLTVYDPAFSVPAWYTEGAAYQVFPDRFRDGDPANNPVDGGGWWYGGETDRALAWGAPFAGDCAGADQKRAQCFAGGDLAGIRAQLPQVAEMGVRTLYLNPIFEAATNHRYDTINYLHIDPELGTLADFDALVAEADALGIRLVLDGVFNHVSADSIYFDLYSRWDAGGALTSPGGQGSNDGSGACESADSVYRSWFFIPHRWAAGRDERTGETVTCAGGETYEAWATFFHIPKLNAADPGVREMFWDAPDAVGPWWVGRGAGGWRLDVAADVDRGLAHDPGNDFWEGFRSSVKAEQPDAVIIGEEWGDATALLLGPELDTVMNYRWRSAALDWMFDGCAPGPGCDGDGFSDNDSAAWRDSGRIDRIDEAGLLARLESIREDTPPPAWMGMYNLLGSHDTSRVGWLLQMVSGGDATLAREKLRFLTVFQFTYPGVPAVYMGDEVGVAPASNWDGGVWQDDPWNRATYPWADLGFSPDTALRDWVVTMGQLRAGSPALHAGAYETVSADPSQQVFAYLRSAGEDARLVVLHRGASSRSVSVPSPFPDGTVLEDALSGAAVTVSDGAVAFTAAALSGSVWAVAAPSEDTGDPEDTGTSGGGDSGGGGVGGDGSDGGASDSANPDDGPGPWGRPADGKACGCAAPGATAGGLAWLGGLVALWARRRTGRRRSG